MSNGRVSNLLLYCSLGSVIVAFIVFNILQSKEMDSQNEYLAVSKQVHFVIKDTKEDISEKLRTILEGTEHISTVEVYNQKSVYQLMR